MTGALVATTQDLSIFNPVTPSGNSASNLFLLVLAITGAILLLVEGVLIYNMIRFPWVKSPAVTQPPQVYGSIAIEIAWTAAPLLIVFVLTLLVARGIWEVRVNTAKPPDGAKPVNITVIGHQWWWEYIYTTSDGKELGFTTANELHMPVSDAAVARPAYLSLQSADVNHSFWIPRMNGKTDLVPGRTNTMSIETLEKNLYLGQCNVYCGTAHARMLLRVYVDSLEDFDKWVENQRKPAVDDPSARIGRATFLNLSCVNCHTIRGTPANGSYAPDLTHLMSRDTIGAGILTNTPENIAKWVHNSQLLKAGCLMPEFKLSDQELSSVVHYLTTLR